MSDLYLILHKVRGEPAFDIAQKLIIGDEEGWIVPTSGHRAYPYYHEPLTMLYNPQLKDDWKDWPDHFRVRKAEPPPKLNVRELLKHIRPTLSFKRRI